MIHISKDELDEIDVKLITNKFIKVKECRIITFGFGLLVLRICLLLINQFLLHITFQDPLKSAKNIENKSDNVSMRGLR